MYYDLLYVCTLNIYRNRLFQMSETSAVFTNENSRKEVERGRLILEVHLSPAHI